MNYRDRILKDIADAECEKISERVIFKLRKRKDQITFRENGYCFMSRQYTGLKTVWDEICVQTTEAKFSAYWSYFEIVVNGYIEAELAKLSEPLQKAIWLQTDEADENWENYECGEAEVEIDHDELVKYIADEYVYRKARSWRNARIENYLMEEPGRDYGEFKSFDTALFVQWIDEYKNQ